MADEVAVQGRIRLRRGKVDGCNSTIGKRYQLARIGDAVLVGVDPDAQVRELRIAAVDNAIAVRIERGQNREAVSRGVSEKLVYVVDLTVAIAVDGKEPVAAGYPTRPFRKSVGVQIEEGLRPVQCRKLDPVSIKI